jgi:sigma-B regulation protein RsbU (phosphoserine phosphatase)
VTLVDAGHNPPLVAGPGGVQELPGIPKGPALGVMEDMAYASGAFALDPATTLVLYTDGVPEARGTSGELFGDARLRAAVAAAGPSPSEVVSSVVASVERFAAGAPPDDDVTVLALRYARP